MALVLPSPPPHHPMTTSILLRPHTFPSPAPSPSPSPSSIPLPALQIDLSSSSSSASGSYFDLHRNTSARSRRIRFAPLPDPNRDFLDNLSDDSQLNPKPAPQTASTINDTQDGFVTLSPSISPDSTLSSTRSTSTICNAPSSGSPKPALKLLRTLPFLRRTGTSSLNSSPLSQSSSLSPSCNSLPSSIANSPSSPPAKLSRISTEDILTLGTKSLFRTRSGSTARPPRPSSPPPKSLDLTKPRHRAASTGSGPGISLGGGKRDRGEGSSQSQHIHTDANKRPSSSSGFTPGAGGGRHASSTRMVTNDPPRPSTAPSSPSARPKRHVKMLNGRIYGAKRYAAQTLANPFASARDEPEFVEWGYGGMGSVHASAGIANDMWKGLQRSERGGALLAGSSDPPESVIAGGGRGSGSRATSPIARRRMSDNVPECGMGNVGAGGDEDDGSGMAWVKKRRAEKEAKTRLEEAARELEKKTREGRKSGESIDASLDASTASTTTSLTACTSVASTDLTTPTTSPFASRSPSVTELKLTPSPLLGTRDLRATSPCAATGEQSLKVDIPTSQPVPASKDEHEHHVLTAVRLSPNVSSSSHKHSYSTTQLSSSQIPSQTRNHRGIGRMVPESPADTEMTISTNSDEGEQGLDLDEEERDLDDDEEEVQDTRRKTALGAGVEKVSRHIDVEAR